MKCEVRNANYERVQRVIEKFLRDRYIHACCCEICISDMAAISLNLLPPHYYSTAAGSVCDFGSPWVMIESAVTEAIERVIDNPRHEDLERSKANMGG